MKNYTSLQNYTTYSILSGVFTPEKWIKQAKELGYTSLGISEKNTIASWVEFDKGCRKEDIKPLFGMEVLIVPKLYSKNASEKRIPVILYVKDEEGYKNLLNLIFFSQTKPVITGKDEDLVVESEGGFYYKPRIDLLKLSAHSKGLSCIFTTESLKPFKRKDKEGFTRTVGLLISDLRNMFKEDFYIAANPVSDFEESSKLSEVAKEDELILSNNAHYTKKSEHNLYEVIRMIAANQNIREHKDRDIENGYLLPKDCFVDILEEDFIERIDKNFKRFVDSHNYQITYGEVHMPKLFVEESLEVDMFNWIVDGFKKRFAPELDASKIKTYDDLYSFSNRYPQNHLNKGETEDMLETLDVYVDRLKYELGVIESMGFLNYMHIVKTFCDYVDSQGEHRGYSRGSAGGSLVSFCLKITEIDPIRHHLSFERFLNPDRLAVPDIDLDFSMEARDTLKAWIVEQYSKNNYALIGTYARFKVKSAIKKVASAYSYGIPANDGKIVSYDPFTVDRFLDVTGVAQSSRGQKELDEMLENENFKEFYDTHSNWIDNIIMPLQETIANRGIHACGSVITPEHLKDSLPVIWSSKDGFYVTQFAKEEVEDVGYPKFDLLGVDAVSILAKARQLVKEIHGVDIPDIDDIPLDDELALSLYQKSETDGIFQLNSVLNKLFAEKLNPTHFNDISSAFALERPGPRDQGSDLRFADKKNGRIPISFDHDDLIPVLDDTYGELVYQEQMMRAAIVLADFSGAESDHLRKACGKKKLKDMKKWESVFMERCQAKGYEQDFLDLFWAKMVSFSEYAFNKSHSDGYAKLAYHQLYVKARYPREYTCAVLTYTPKDIKKPSNIYKVREAMEISGVKFIFPNVRAFAKGFEPADDGESIHWPLGAIAGVGEKAVNELCKYGRKGFIDQTHMMQETIYKKTPIDMRVWKALINAGFFSEYGTPSEIMDEYIEYSNANKMRKKKPFGYDSHDTYYWLTKQNESYKMQIRPWKEVYKDKFGSKIFKTQGFKFNKKMAGKKLFIGGLVESVTRRKDKNGNSWAKVVLTDLNERYTVNFWSKYWQNIELDKKNLRVREGDLIELIGEISAWSPEDSDRVYYSINVGNRDDYVKIIERKRF